MKKFFEKSGKKNILLSLVALFLVTMMAVGVTYSWIDDLTDYKINTSEGGENTPLTVGHDIHADFNLSDAASKKDAVINIGKVFTENAETHKQTITDGGYFYESGGMHLSPCYGNGITFKIPKRGDDGAVTGYRDATNDDYNVSFISATLRITAPKYKTVFWFDDLPTFTHKRSNSDTLKSDDDEDYQRVRVSITTDGKTDVYAYSDTYSPTFGSSSPSRQFKDYKFYSTENNNNSGNKRTLFSVAKGETKTINVKIWIEGGINNRVNFSNLNMTLVSSYNKTRNITIDNKTTGIGPNTWMTDKNAKVYLAIPAARPDGSTWTANVSYWDISTDIKSSAKATVSVPYGYYDEEMLVFRCSPNHAFAHATSYATGEDKRSTYQIYCWNFWQTILPDSFTEETYTLYGATYDKTVFDLYYGNWVFKNITNKGYGTWSGVVKITFDANYSGNNNHNHAHYYGNSCNVFIEDFSDYAQNGHAYYYTLRPTNSGNNTTWVGYVPTTSKKISFRYHYNTTNIYWGYLTQTDETTTRDRPGDNPTIPTTGYERGDANTFTSWGDIGNGVSKGTWSGTATIEPLNSAPRSKTRTAVIATEPATEKADEAEKSDFLTAAQAKAYAEANGATYFLEGKFEGSDDIYYLPFDRDSDSLTTSLAKNDYDVIVCKVSGDGEVARVYASASDEGYMLADGSVSIAMNGGADDDAKLSLEKGDYTFEYNSEEKVLTVTES